MATRTAYVRARDGNLYVGSSRVTLDSVIIPWQMKRTPEEIQADFPTVPLADIYGAIAYYLAHQAEVDAWLREGEELYERRRAEQQAADPEFYARMRERMEAARASNESDLR
jgi:uncharacterized protein (DUF433 family)